MSLTRRDFLKTSGALIVGFSAGSMVVTRAQGPLQGSPAMNQLDSWIAIAADGSVTAFSGKEELGQGISTAQQQLVAEELSVPFNRVKLIYCDTALTPDQAHTSGSQSHPANFNQGNLAQAGATARETLFRMASQKLGVPVEQLTASDGVISSGSKHRCRPSPAPARPPGNSGQASTCGRARGCRPVSCRGSAHPGARSERR